MYHRNKDVYLFIKYPLITLQKLQEIYISFNSVSKSIILQKNLPDMKM